jgi:hypothetical protein
MPTRVIGKRNESGWIVLFAALFIALGAIVWEFRRTVPFLVMFAMEPAGSGCDEARDRPQRHQWAGRCLEEYIRACKVSERLSITPSCCSLEAMIKRRNWSNTIGSITDIQSFAGSTTTRSASILEKSIP